MFARHLAASALILAASAAAAQDDLVGDADGDGMVSYPEATEAYVDMTEEVFTTIDINGDGLWDAAELEAAMAAGLVMPAEG